MKNVLGAKCMICSKFFEDFEYVCPEHQSEHEPEHEFDYKNEGILDIKYDYNLIKKTFTKQKLANNKDKSIWRYTPLLPINENSPVPNLFVGNTPLYSLNKLADKFNVKNLYLKDDSRLPTASFKDRASAIALVKAWEKKADVITAASTGNAGAALSGLCASSGKENVIFVPASAPQAKVAQLLMFGSKVMLVNGTYDDAFDLCLKAAQEYGWYNRNTGFNPYMSEGKKTCSFEICEQLKWKVPDKIFVSVGDGCIIGGIYKGLKDLFKMGWIDHIPKLIGIQAEKSSYMYQAWKNNENIITKPFVKAETLADSISAGLPRDRIKALKAVKNTKGEFITVSDKEILRAIPDLAKQTGVFAEPAGAATWAGFLKAVKQNILSFDESIVIINTGSGLKDINNAMKSVELTNMKYNKVEPSIDKFRKMMAS